jgi:hypothetical protein
LNPHNLLEIQPMAEDETGAARSIEGWVIIAQEPSVTESGATSQFLVVTLWL